MTAVTQRAATHYDRVVNAWWYLMGEDLHFGYFEQPDTSLAQATQALTNLMARRAGLAPGMSVLDVGCGTGNPALYLARVFGCRVHGISPSTGCVEHAQHRAASAGLEESVSFSIRDGMANGFEDWMFDRVWIMEAAHLIPDKNKLLCESARVLCPSGKLVLCDVMPRRELQPSEILSMKADLRTIDAVFGRGKTELMSAYVAMAEAAGLRVECALDISDEVRPTFAAWRRNAEIHSEEVTKLIGEKALRQFKEACDAFSRLWREKVLGYGLLVAARAQKLSLFLAVFGVQVEA